MEKRSVWSVLIIALVAGVLVPFLMAVFFLSLTKSGTYEATLTYSPLATGEGPIGITNARVTGFRKTSGFSLIPLSFPLFYNVEAHITVFCNDEKVYSYVDKFRMTEFGGFDRNVKLVNLPPDSNCRVSIDLVCEPMNRVYCSDDVELTYQFSTPSI